MKFYINDIYYDMVKDCYYKIESIDSKNDYIILSEYLSIRTCKNGYVEVKEYIRSIRCKRYIFADAYDYKLKLIYRDKIFM